MGPLRVILLLVSIFAPLTLAAGSRAAAERADIDIAMRPLGMQPDYLIDQIPLEGVRTKFYKLKRFHSDVH